MKVFNGAMLGSSGIPRTWWVAPMCGLVVALASVLCALMRAWDSVAMGWFYSGVLFVATVVGFSTAHFQIRHAGSAARRKAAKRILAVFLCFSASGLLTALAIQQTLKPA